MAGVKGRSGGARPGAGRKPKPKPESAVQVGMEPQPHGGALKRKKAAPVQVAPRDMLTLLQDIALGVVEVNGTQLRAAIAAVQYTHAKKGESSGAKEAKDAAAKAAGAGKFGRREAPKLVAAGGKKV
jgi:phage terminase small subunit